MEKTENPFLMTLRLPVKKPPILLIVGTTVHFVCLFLPWFTGLAIYINMMLTFIVIVSFCFYLVKYRFHGTKKRIKELILSSEDKWQIKMSDGAVHYAHLGNDLFVHPWLTIFSLADENNREYFIFTPEILDPDQFRRLRVRLRFRIAG